MKHWLALCLLLAAAVNIFVIQSQILKYFLQNAILVVEHIKVEHNSSIINYKFNRYNEPNKDSVLSAVIWNYAKSTDIRVYLVARMSSNSKNPDYNIEFMKTTVDVKMLFKGAFANPVLKSLLQNFFAAADFELKFPFLPVQQNQIIIISSNKLLAGNLQH